MSDSIANHRCYMLEKPFQNHVQSCIDYKKCFMVPCGQSSTKRTFFVSCIRGPGLLQPLEIMSLALHAATLSTNIFCGSSGIFDYDTLKANTNQRGPSSRKLSRIGWKCILRRIPTIQIAKLQNRALKIDKTAARCIEVRVYHGPSKLVRATNARQGVSSSCQLIFAH